MSTPVLRSYGPMDSGPQDPFNLDFVSITQAVFGVYIVDGQCEYSLEATLDDVNDPEVTPRWFTLDEFPVGTNVTKYALSFNPWRFGRINLALITGQVELKVQQAFISGNRY